MPDVQIAPDRLEWLKSVVLGHGTHRSFEAGVCVMEAVAYVAGEPHSDRPRCVDPAIIAAAIRINDSLDDVGRQKLKELVPRMIGTAGGEALARKRGWLAADWVMRQMVPRWLEAAGLPEHAQALRAGPEVTEANLGAAREVARAAHEAARSKRAAAFDGLRKRVREEVEKRLEWTDADAADDAVAAADAAKKKLSYSQAYWAAYEAIRGKLYESAKAAALKRLNEVRLHQSVCFELLERMIELKV